MQPEKKMPGVGAPGFVSSSHAIGEIHNAHISANIIASPTAIIRLGRTPPSGIVTDADEGLSPRQMAGGSSGLGYSGMIAPLRMPARLMATLAAYQLFTTAEPDPDLWQELQLAGIDLDHVTNLAGPIVRALATIEDGRVYADDFGEVVMVIAAHDEDAETVVDLVAWSARYPEIFGTMFGTSILGIDHLLNPATYVAGHCRLFTNPLTWLKGGCAGAVILNRAEASGLLENAQGPFSTDTIDHALDLFRSGVVPSNRLMVPSDWRLAA